MRAAARAIAAGWLLALSGMSVGLTGCFRERSFPMQPTDYRPSAFLLPAGSTRLSTVEWLERAHAYLSDRLPQADERALLTRDLRDAGGGPVDLRGKYDLPLPLNSVFSNLLGLLHSAQVTGPNHDDGEPLPAWPGFADIRVDVGDGLELSGRLGLATCDGQVIRSDCIILLPGLLGDNALRRTRDIAEALRESGLHALALEPRGIGQTDARNPDVYCTYGILETGDLLTVAEWLQDQPYVRETGLIGFSWGANQALLAAWEDGRPDDDPGVAPRLRAYLRPRTGRAHFRAGVIAFSPVMHFELVLDKLARQWSLAADPVLSRLQAGVRDRRAHKNFPHMAGDLRRLIEFEVRRAGIDYPGFEVDGYRYLRFLPYRGQEAGDKLERVRVPVLIVQAANDPLQSAQAVVDALAHVRNPHVACVILPGGGHNGFPAYARAYYYGLIMHFFGARPCGHAWHVAAAEQRTSVE